MGVENGKPVDKPAFKYYSYDIPEHLMKNPRSKCKTVESYELLVKLFPKASALAERWCALLKTIVFYVVCSPITTFTASHSLKAFKEHQSKKRNSQKVHSMLTFPKTPLFNAKCCCCIDCGQSGHGGHVGILCVQPPLYFLRETFTREDCIPLPSLP